MIDANCVIDLVLVELKPPTVRADAAARLLAVCCVAYFSKKLWYEVIENCHQNAGVPVPRFRVIELVESLQCRDKVKTVRKSKLDETPIPKEVRKRAPPKDVHVVQLALAAGARWILSTDGPLRESARGFKLTEPLRIESPEWVLENVPRPAAPCSS